MILNKRSALTLRRNEISVSSDRTIFMSRLDSALSGNRCRRRWLCSATHQCTSVHCEARMHHKRTTSTCMSVIQHDFDETIQKRERALRISGENHRHSALDCPEISRRRRRDDDAPTAVRSTWRSVFIRRVRRVSWTIMDRITCARAKPRNVTTARGLSRGAVASSWNSAVGTIVVLPRVVVSNPVVAVVILRAATPVTTHALSTQFLTSHCFTPVYLTVSERIFKWIFHIPKTCRKNHFLNSYNCCTIKCTQLWDYKAIDIVELLFQYVFLYSYEIA